MRPLHTDSDQFKPFHYAATIGFPTSLLIPFFSLFLRFASTQRINDEIQMNLHSQLKGIAYAQKSARGARRLRTKINIRSYPHKNQREVLVTYARKST